MTPFTLSHIAKSLAISGTLLSVAGALANNLLLDPLLARELWMISNPIMLMLVLGNRQGLWNGNISNTAVAITYGIFTVSNLASFFL